MAVSSCGSIPDNRALEKAVDSGVIQHELKKDTDQMPFSAIYLSPDYAQQRTAYKKVYIAPISGEKLFEKKNPSKDQKQKFAQETLKFQDQLATEIKKKSKGKMIVVSAPAKDALILEMDVIDVSRNNVFMNIASFLIPLPASSQVAHVFFQGRVDMVARIREPKKNEVIAEIFDHNPGKYSLYSVKDYKRYGHAVETMDVWKDIFSDMFSEPKAKKISAPVPLTAKPV